MKAKKLLSLFLALVMTLSLCSVPAFADTTDNSDNVAEISGVGYATLAEAVEAAEDGDTVTLLANVTMSATLEIEKSITLDLNEKTLSKSLASTTDKTPVIKALSGTVEIKNGEITYDISTYTGTAAQSNANVINVGMNMSNGIYSGGDCDLTLNGVDVSVTFPKGKVLSMIYVESGKLNVINSNLSATNVSGNTSAQYLIYTTAHASAKVNPYVSISGSTTLDTNSSAGIHAIWLQGSKDTLIISGNDVTISADATWKPNSYTTSYGYAVNNQYGTCTIEGGKFLGKVWQAYGTINVSGGYFGYAQGTSGQKNKITLAEGYEYLDNTDSATMAAYPYVVAVPASYVAQIGNTKYETLVEAIAAVPANGTATTITMLADETIATEQTGEVITIASGKNIVLDLNGKTISGTSTQKSNYFIANYGTLEIKDDTNTGKITFRAVADEGYSVENVTVYNENGTLTLSSGAIENTTNGGLSYAVKNSSNAWGHSVVSTFNMTGGSLLGAQTDNTLRVYQNTGIGWKVESKNYVNISGGYIENGIFFDTVLYTPGQNATDFDATDITRGCVIDSVVNISGGTVKGLVDLKIRHPYSTALNITGGDFTNATLRVRKYAAEYGKNLTAGTIPEPTDPMVNISGGRFAFADADTAFQNNSWTSYAEAYSITGGKFSVDPSAHVAEGYQAVANNDDDAAAYPYVIGEAVNYVAQIGATKYETLEAAIAAAQDGETVTVLADCAGNGIKVPQGKFTTGLTVNFDDHTYTVDGSLVGSTGTETQAFQLLKDNKITFRNGTITSAKAKMLIQNYSDLTLEGMTLTLNNPNYAYAYTLSNNNGNVVIDSTTINANPAGGYAFDVCRYASYTSVHVTVQGTSVINGNVEISASKNDAKDGFGLTLTSGTLNGSIVLDSSAVTAMEATPETATVTKADAFTQTAPAGYKWNDNGDGTSSLVKVNYVAQIGDVKYETLEAAIAAAQDGDTVTLLTDVNVSETVEITKSITLDGGNHVLTTTATRGIWIDSSDVTVTIENMEIVSSNNTMERSIQVNPNCDNVTLNLNHITTTATYYTVNICSYVDNLTLNIANCNLTGWGVINLWGNNGTVNVSNSTLVGINDKSYNAEGWNDFGVIILEGDTTGNTDEHSTAYGVTVTNCNITATSTTGNTQYVLLHNNPSAYNSLALVLCTITVGANCEFYCDDAVESVTKIRDTFISGTNNVPTLPEGYVYAPIADNYQLITQAVAQIGNTKYETLEAAIAAAQDGDTVELLTDVTSIDGFIINKTISIDTNGKTITVITGANASNRAFKITSGTLTVYGGGTIDAQGAKVADKGTSAAGTGTYGAFRVESGASLDVSNVTLKNYRPWGKNIKVTEGATARIENVAFISEWGGAVEAGGDVEIINCTVEQTGYFDWNSTPVNVCYGATAIVRGGNYSAAGYGFYVNTSGGTIKLYNVDLQAAAGYYVLVADKVSDNYCATYDGNSYIEVYGGTYNGGFRQQANSKTGETKIIITGGTFDHDPTDYVAPGYEAVKINNTTWQVGEVKASAIAPAAANENYDATYTATKQVISTDGEDTVISEAADITVNVKVITEGTVASDTELAKIDEDALQGIISEAIETVNTTEETIEVRISVVSDEGTTSIEENTITYEVHPVATAIVNNVEVGSVVIGNDALADDASFTITLPVPVSIAADGGRVKVSHISDDGENGTEIGTYEVVDGKVTLVVTHFSKFELAPDDLATTATAKYSATLTLNNNIDVNFYVFNLSGEAENYTVEFTFNGEKTIVPLENAPHNESGVYGFVAASCRAEQMGDTINIVVKYNGKTIYSLDYSVKTYCERQIAKRADQTLVDLCKSTLEYGAYAQMYFNYKTDALVTEKYSANKVVAGASPIGSSFNVTGSVNNGAAFSGASATLTLASETEVNFYFKPATGYTDNDYQFTATKGGEEVTPIIGAYDGWIVVTVKGFAATELNDAVEVTGTNSNTGESKTITYSPMSYAYRMQNEEGTGTICQALYYYYLAAKAFFEAHP